jgi:hypothetical protein
MPVTGFVSVFIPLWICACRKKLGWQRRIGFEPIDLAHWHDEQTRLEGTQWRDSNPEVRFRNRDKHDVMLDREFTGFWSVNVTHGASSEAIVDNVSKYLTKPLGSVSYECRNDHRGTGQLLPFSYSLWKVCQIATKNVCLLDGREAKRASMSHAQFPITRIKWIRDQWVNDLQRR